jgi:hypothetical protein
MESTFPKNTEYKIILTLQLSETGYHLAGRSSKASEHFYLHDIGCHKSASPLLWALGVIMGHSLSWLAVQGKAVEVIHQQLGLTGT